MAVLTSLTHHDQEFADMLMAAARSNSVLAPIIAKSGISMLPARLTLAGEIPTEDELKGIFLNNILSTAAQAVHSHRRASSCAEVGSKVSAERRTKAQCYEKRPRMGA